MAGHVLLETIAFEGLPDGTARLIDTGVFQSVEDRDAMLSTGMEAALRVHGPSGRVTEGGGHDS
jgi:hypothetical protein